MDKKILTLIAEKLNKKVEDIKMEARLVEDLGADSLDVVELVMAFEDEFGIEVSYEELEKKVKTVGDAIEFLREQGADI